MDANTDCSEDDIVTCTLTLITELDQIGLNDVARKIESSLTNVSLRLIFGV